MKAIEQSQKAKSRGEHFLSKVNKNATMHRTKKTPMEYTFYRNECRAIYNILSRHVGGHLLLYLQFPPEELPLPEEAVPLLADLRLSDLTHCALMRAALSEEIPLECKKA